MKIVVLSDPVGERVAEEDLARRRMLADYDRLKQARDEEMRRERDFQASKYRKLSDERNAAMRAEYNRQRSKYESAMAARNAKIDAEYYPQRSEYERLVAERIAAIDAERNRNQSEYERLAAERNAKIDAEYNRNQSEYERLSTERSAQIAEDAEKRRQRLKRRVGWWPPLSRFICAPPPAPPSAEEMAKRHPEPPRPSALDAAPHEAAWRTRAAGERDLDARLAERLPSDDWILISGYRGSGGAIDRVIAGPFGVCALNVLHVMGRVSVNSHSWRIQRYNSDGVWFESTKIVDGYGRSPSARLDQSAQSLETLLASRKLVNSVNRAVVLTHGKSRLDSVFNPTVEFIRSLDDLSVVDMFGYRGALLAGASADYVARAVIADHEENSRDSETR